MLSPVVNSKVDVALYTFCLREALILRGFSGFAHMARKTSV